MTRVGRYNFRKVHMDDVPMLMAWLAQPHVSEWWEADGPYDQEHISDPRVSRWIVSLDGHPFAYMQDYAVHGWEDHYFAHLPPDARGIDRYVGDANLIGLGHGTAFIGARMQVLFDQGTCAIATDPHPENHRAIRVYRKLGFKPIGGVQDTQWGPILPMVAEFL